MGWLARYCVQPPRSPLITVPHDPEQDFLFARAEEKLLLCSRNTIRLRPFVIWFLNSTATAGVSARIVWHPTAVRMDGKQVDGHSGKILPMRIAHKHFH